MIISRVIREYLRRHPRCHDALRVLYWKVHPKPPAVSALEHIFGGRKEFTFIQVGANDGLGNDPLRPLVLATPGAHGIFVEPITILFERLKYNYHHLRNPKLHFFQGAISDRPGEMRLWSVKPSAIPDLPLMADQLASSSKDHIISHFKHIPNIKDLICETTLPCITIEQLRKKYNMPSLDLVAIDVEGHEKQVIDGMDLEADPPSAILFEAAHLEPQTVAILTERLNVAGYQISRLGADALALHAHFHGLKHGCLQHPHARRRP